MADHIVDQQSLKIVTFKVGHRSADIDIRNLCTNDLNAYIDISPIFKVFGKHPTSYFTTRLWGTLSRRFEDRHDIAAVRSDHIHSRLAMSAINYASVDLWLILNDHIIEFYSPAADGYPRYKLSYNLTMKEPSIKG